MTPLHSTSVHFGFHADPESGVCFRTLDFLGFVGYRVGDDGSVWSRFVPGPGSRLGELWKLLKSHPVGKSGHLCVGLYSQNTYRKELIHRLVLMAFVGPCPPGMECCHFPNRESSDNRLANLRWDTAAANQKDRIVHGTDDRGEKSKNAKLSNSDVIGMRADRQAGCTLEQLAAKYKVSVTTVCLVVNRKRWAHL